MSVFFKRSATQALHRFISKNHHQRFSVYAVNFAQNDDARGSRGGAAAAQRSPPGQPQQMPQAQQQQLRQQQQNLQQEVQKARPSSQPGQYGGANRSQQEASLGVREAASKVESQRQQQLQQHNERQNTQAQGQQYGQQQNQQRGQQQNQQQNKGQDSQSQGQHGQQPRGQQQNQQHSERQAQSQQSGQQNRGQQQPQSQQSGQQQRGQQQNQHESRARNQRDNNDDADNQELRDDRGNNDNKSRDRNSSGRQMMSRGGGDDGGEGHGRPADRVKPNRYLKRAPTGLIEGHNANFAGRDTENFPRVIPPRYPPELRHFFIPRSYFDFFYEKTGATGGYSFGLSFIVFLMSKEYFIFEHEANMFLPLGIILWATCKYGVPHLNKYCENARNQREQSLIDFQEKSMEYLQEELDLQDNRVYSAEASVMLAQAKRENVALQQEALYRQRLKTAYDEVKKRLDYYAAIQSAQRRAEKKHMMQWVLQNVRDSLTDQSEKEALRACVDALAQMKPSQ